MPVMVFTIEKEEKDGRAEHRPAGAGAAGRITDRAGNDAPIDGDPVWRSTDPALMTVDADPADAEVAVCVPMDNAADSTVIVECEVDADSVRACSL